MSRVIHHISESNDLHPADPISVKKTWGPVISHSDETVLDDIKEDNTSVIKTIDNQPDSTHLNILLKKTRRGQIRRIVREIYLRDDISCGVLGCDMCDMTDNPGILTMEKEDDCIFIIDYSVVQYQVDFLCSDPCINNCVFPSTALEQIRQKNRQSYSRLRHLCQYKSRDTESQLNDFKDIEVGTTIRRFYVYSNHISRSTHVERLNGELISDYNERSVWMLAKWYQNHISMGIESHSTHKTPSVILLTNSSLAKNRAIAFGIPSMTIFEYVTSVSHQFPGAGETLAITVEEEEEEEQNKNLITGIDPVTKKCRTANIKAFNQEDKRKPRYPSHLKLEQIQEELNQGLLHKGIVRMDRQSYLCGTVSTSKYSSIRILGYRNLNRSVDGDFVAVRLIKKEEKLGDTFIINEDIDEEITKDIDNPPIEIDDVPMENNTTVSNNDVDSVTTQYGTVVGIIKRNWKEYSGSLIPMFEEQKLSSTNFVKTDRQFRPWDPRVPDIVIKTRQSAQLEGKRLIVVIDGWDRYNKYPSGHWTEILGDVDDPEVEAKVILKEYDVITREFSDSVLRCLPPSNYTIPQNEIDRRLDLRESIACSIDPPGCKDIDDALSCQKLPNGNFLVGVHIADVTHFVLPDTCLDKEAAQRCTTVYLVERRTDMLPGLLTSDLCSLVPNADRLTFSVLWEISSDAQIISTDFRKAIIQSRRAFTYEEAQSLLDDANDRTPLKNCIKHLHQLAQSLRQKRMSGGALELASLEAKFQLDNETHSPNDIDTYKIRDTNKLVEEFMLLANTYVARFILQHLPLHSVLRRHPPPKEDHLKSLQTLLRTSGFENFDFSSSLALARSLNAAQKPNDPYFNKAVRVLTTRCMNQALYVCSGDINQRHEDNVIDHTDLTALRHYGLAIDLYTHFTSPIRRYADILVHRLLAVALEMIPLPDQLYQKSLISEQCDQMNLKHRNAQWASRASVDFYTYRYFKTYGAAKTDALVIAVKKNGLQVQLPRYGIEGIIIIDSKRFEWDAAAQKLVYKKTMNDLTTIESIGVFDNILVEIYADCTDFRPKTIIQFIEKLLKPTANNEDDTSIIELFNKQIFSAEPQ